MTLLTHIGRFRKAEEGAALLIFALAIFIVIGGIAFAIDVSRFFAVKSRLGIASEMAVVMAAKNLRFLTTSELELLTYETVQANFRGLNLLGLSGEALALPSVSLAPDLESGEVTLTTQVEVTTTFLRLFNFLDNVFVSKTITARQERPEAEVALVIEASDAMATSGALDAVKSVSIDFISLLETEIAAGEGINWALVPFGNAIVNVAPHMDWVATGQWPVNIPPYIPGTTECTGNLAEDRWCVAPRPDAAGNNATPPLSSKFPLILTLASEIDPGTGLPHFTNVTTADCRAERILDLGPAAEITSAISALGGNGEATYGRAMLWAERLLSPLWQGAWNAATTHPVAYETGKISKVALLVVGSAASDASENSRLTDTCERMKGNGIALYVIDYLAPEATAASLAACATTAGHYFRVADTAGLRGAFFSIAKFLTVVRFSG